MARRMLSVAQRAEIDAAFAAGSAAFGAGIKSAPMYDAPFMASLGSRALGDPASLSAEKLAAWSRGWHRANLAAPIDVVESES